jgi:hypothetical protein
MYHSKRHTILTGALSLAVLISTAGQAPARVSSGGVAAAETADTGQGVPHETPWTTNRDGYSCSCVDTYMGGREVSVASCDNANARCADIDVLVDCQEDPDGPDCDYLRQCECDCTALEETVEFEHGPFEDVVLTGVPDLWQFDFMCGSNLVSANAVGCGPVSAAMVMYWWAQQGYEELVDDFLLGDGSGPEDREHDWQALVRELRANYLNGGICVPSLNGNPQYATLMEKMATGMREYIEDAGYAARVEHWKVCEDCNAGEADEILGGDALALIKDELEAGRPVIMGFNAGKALDVRVPIYHDGTYDMVYIGELSNGAPVTGIISHYAVITGYRRLSGLDVLSLNLGWNDGTTDQLVAWNPGGKWMHLYTVDITEPARGTPWCAIDRGVDENRTPPTAAAFSQPYIEISHVESSTPSPTNELIPLAGTSCGIAREGTWVNYYDTTHQLEMCVTAGDLPTEEDMTDLFEGQTTTMDTRDDSVLNTGGGPPILNQELPLP